MDGGFSGRLIAANRKAGRAARRAAAAVALLAALCACDDSERDEIDVESAAILARVPIGTSFDDLPAAMRSLGFACTPGRKQFISKGRPRDADPHFECIREETYMLACKRRTRAILLQLNGRLSNILVNIGYFCAQLAAWKESKKAPFHDPAIDGIECAGMTDLGYEIWGLSGPYERYGGRWSRKVASEFLDWLDVPPQRDWGDVGCGTGALVDGILARFDPKTVAAIDLSEGYIAELRGRIHDPRARFDVGDATSLPWPSASSDATVAGLVLNFVSDPAAMVKEMARVTRPGGKVAAYLWDYPRGMQMMQHFWDVAFKLDPNQSVLDRAERHPLSQPEPLGALFKAAGLKLVSVRIIEIPTVFRDFDDYWRPFLGKQGAAPTYFASLDIGHRSRIRDALKARLTPSGKGSIAMTARAWAVRGTV